MRVRFRLADVFAEVPFTGNQLCVVPEPPADLSPELMLALAQEIGFSETAFVVESARDRYVNRIFTPVSELPFAGHPTIGTAFVLAAEDRVGSQVVQVTEAGEVPVEVDLEGGRATMRQLPPVFGPEFPDRELVARAAGLRPEDLRPDLPVRTVSTGLPPLLVPVVDNDALARAVRDDAACAAAVEASGGECLYLFAVRGDGDVRARMFDAAFSIGEDPATGSAAGSLGAYLAEHGLAGMPGRCIVAQGEQVGRPSFLHLDVTRADGSWVVRVGGGVRIVGEGAFEL